MDFKFPLEICLSRALVFYKPQATLLVISQFAQGQVNIFTFSKLIAE